MFVLIIQIISYWTCHFLLELARLARARLLFCDLRFGGGVEYLDEPAP
jgi:hypothetical protein